MLRDLLIGIAIVVVSAWMLWISNVVHTQAVDMAKFSVSMNYMIDKVDSIEAAVTPPSSKVANKR